MAQYGLDQDFQRMIIHDPRKQLSPTIARKPQISGSVYRAGPAPYRSYEDRQQEDLPPPPPSQSYLDNYPVPPPPPDPKENIYHEITDDFPPPPPTEAPPAEVYRSPEPVHVRSSSGFNQTSYGGPGGQSYETRHESHTLVQPSGRYEREVKQATYSIQSSDSSGRSSPYGSSSHYGNLNTYSTSNMINNPPPPPTQPYLSSSEAQPYSTTSLYDTSGQYGSPNSARQYQDSHVTYAQIQSKQEPSGGVTYAQIAPKSDRPVPGPQVPIQIKVSDSRRGEPEPSGQVQYQASSLSKTGNQYSKYSPGQQYSTSSTGKQYSASPLDQQYGASGPGPQYAGSNPGPQYSSNGPGNQYSSNPGPHYPTSQGSRYSGGQMSQYSSSGPGQQYSSNPGPQYSTGPNYSGAQYAGSSPGPQYASSGPGPQYAGSNPGPQYAGSNPGPQYSGSPSTMYSQSKPAYGTSDNKPSNSKEEEVDALTQMLMQGLEGTKEADFYGICTKCGKKVVGETNGCTAMDQVYHIACFICVGCGKLLRGESFYAMERKPFCENCYVNSLEKCSVCSKPITDRLLRATGKPYHAICFTCVVCGKSLDGIPLLRATGKPYHPACFTCVVCGKSLDGIPFTVDATNQIHCIECFHSKFAPRCCVCYNPIMPEKGQEETVRVVAMDRSFHVGCYRCEDCHTQLSSEAEGRGCYPLDDHILCKNCNAKRINALTTKLSTEL